MQIDNLMINYLFMVDGSWTMPPSDGIFDFDIRSTQ
jgi:hypothetical protein